MASKLIGARRRERALKLLEEGKVTFARAAELAGISLWELAELVRERKIEWVHLTPQEIGREFKLASEAGENAT